jgi:hypothetical protein
VDFDHRETCGKSSTTREIDLKSVSVVFINLSRNDLETASCKQLRSLDHVERLRELL